MQEIQKRLFASNPKMTVKEDEVLEKETLIKIRDLALLNFRLNKVMSLPHLIFIFLNVFNAILTICMMVICQVNAALVFHGTVTCFYLFYLLSLNRLIVSLVKSILGGLRNKYLYFSFDTTTSQTALAHQHRQLQITSMELYVGYFGPIKLFHLIRLEVAFVFQTGFFMLAYIVFITQTN